MTTARTYTRESSMPQTSLGYSPAVIHRFLSYLRPQGDCCTWAGDPKGFVLNDQFIEPAVFAYEFGGRLIGERTVARICGNDWCVRGEHLIARNKPRKQVARSNGKVGPTSASFRRLLPHEVQRIRHKRWVEKLSYAEIVSVWGITEGRISDIVNGRTHADVPWEPEVLASREAELAAKGKIQRGREARRGNRPKPKEASKPRMRRVQ